jgi:hypothetical protein
MNSGASGLHSPRAEDVDAPTCTMRAATGNALPTLARTLPPAHTGNACAASGSPMQSEDVNVKARVCGGGDGGGDGGDGGGDGGKMFIEHAGLPCTRTHSPADCRSMRSIAHTTGSPYAKPVSTAARRSVQRGSPPCAESCAWHAKGYGGGPRSSVSCHTHGTAPSSLAATHSAHVAMDAHSTWPPAPDGRRRRRRSSSMWMCILVCVCVCVGVCGCVWGGWGVWVGVGVCGSVLCVWVCVWLNIRW